MAFLQHLNSQQPTIRFTMEIEKDSTSPFLDTTHYQQSETFYSRGPRGQ